MSETNEELVSSRPSRRVRAAYAYDVDTVSRESGLVCEQPGRTDQSAAAETDINYIVEQFGVTGKLPMSMMPPSYGDFSGAGDYQTAMDLILDAQNAFMSLPSRVRATFENDPAAFVAFCEDPANLPQLREWGLAPNPEPLGPSSSEPESPSSAPA